MSFGNFTLVSSLSVVDYVLSVQSVSSLVGNKRRLSAAIMYVTFKNETEIEVINEKNLMEKRNESPNRKCSCQRFAEAKSLEGSLKTRRKH
jgi:hypothetical protein